MTDICMYQEDSAIWVCTCSPASNVWDHSSNLSQADQPSTLLWHWRKLHHIHWALSDAGSSKHKCCPCLTLQLCSVLCTLSSHARAPQGCCRALGLKVVLSLSWAGHWGWGLCFPCPVQGHWQHPLTALGCAHAVFMHCTGAKVPAAGLAQHTACPGEFVNVYSNLLLSATTPWLQLDNSR